MSHEENFLSIFDWKVFSDFFSDSTFRKTKLDHENLEKVTKDFTDDVEIANLSAISSTTSFMYIRHITNLTFEV